MSAQEHRALVSQYAEEVWTRGNVESTEKYIARDYVRHDPGIPFQVRGPEAVKQLVSAYRAAFPDMHFTADDTIAEGDRVVVRWEVRGTQRGELMGIAPTGRRIRLTAIEIFRLAEGKIVEQWVLVDSLGMLQQLGVFPPPEQAGS